MGELSHCTSTPGYGIIKRYAAWPRAERTQGDDRMKRLVIGILAHVDSGKTTLSEAMLYRAGALRKLGRVDHRDAFLDTDALERERGITIFSKQALLSLPEEQRRLVEDSQQCQVKLKAVELWEALREWLRG